jgi:hypothetical protein
MGPLRTPRSGSRAEGRAQSAPAWEREWLEAAAVEWEESAQAVAERPHKGLVVAVGAGAVLAALLPGIFPLTPGFSAADTVAAVVAAAVAATVAIAIVPLTQRLGRELPRSGASDKIVFAVALFSAGAAAIHLAVAKTHFDEYTLFGVFFVGSGVAQLVWPIWLLLRRWRPLLVLGALGNGLIVALWAVDRIWGLPLGPEHWKPDPVGFGDSVTAAFELLVVAGCLMLLARDRERPLRVSVGAALTLAVTALTALSLLSVLGVGSSFLTPTQ